MFFGVDCWEVSSCWGIKEESVSWDCKDDLWTIKAGIGTWKLTEVDQEIFVRDFRSGCMHKQDCESEGVPNILREFSIFCFEDSFVAESDI